jgi:hypothetical protein
MYYQRASRLDMPLYLREEILNEVNSMSIQQTGMHDSTYKISWAEHDNLVKSGYPEKYTEYIEYYKSIYEKGVENLGYIFSDALTLKIHNHYKSFLSLVPDSPKITIKKPETKAGGDNFHIHNDKLQTATLTCVIKGAGATTAWFDSKPDTAYTAHTYQNAPGARVKNKQGRNPHPSELNRITSICLQPWEMIIFDNNAFHKVENLASTTDRFLFTIGFINISATELEDIYARWWTTQ